MYARSMRRHSNVCAAVIDSAARTRPPPDSPAPVRHAGSRSEIAFDCAHDFIHRRQARAFAGGHADFKFASSYVFGM